MRWAAERESWSKPRSKTYAAGGLRNLPEHLGIADSVNVQALGRDLELLTQHGSLGIRSLWDTGDRMTKRPASGDRARQWCAAAGIAGVLALTAAIHLGGPRREPDGVPDMVSIRERTAPAVATAVPDSSPPVMTEASRSRPFVGRAEQRTARPAAVSARPAAARTHRLDVEPAARHILPAREELPADDVRPAAPIAATVLPQVTGGSLPAVASTPVSLDAPGRPRGPVSRAFARAGAETGRGFRRAGAALARVF